MDKRMERELDYAVLPAAGRGTRMGHLTQDCPKCLIPLNGRPLLDHWLEKCIFLVGNGPNSARFFKVPKKKGYILGMCINGRQCQKS